MPTLYLVFYSLLCAVPPSCSLSRRNCSVCGGGEGVGFVGVGAPMSAWWPPLAELRPVARARGDNHSTRVSAPASKAVQVNWCCDQQRDSYDTPVPVFWGVNMSPSQKDRDRKLMIFPGLFFQPILPSLWGVFDRKATASKADCEFHGYQPRVGDCCSLILRGISQYWPGPPATLSTAASRGPMRSDSPSVTKNVNMSRRNILVTRPSFSG